MPEKRNKSKNEGRDQRKGIVAWLFVKPARDETYISDFKAQWMDLDPPGRVKFVLGALIGLILFIGALILAYLVLSHIVG
jgi:hypothetical protein